MASTIRITLMGSSPKKDISLSSEMFGLPWNAALIAQYVRVYMANQKRNVSLGKNRARVQGSTRKVYKQKGTGRARHGDIKAPIYVGGGLAHGPQNNSPALKMPTAMKRKALFIALSQAVRDKQLSVVADSMLGRVKKTKEAQQVLMDTVNSSGNAVVVMPHHSEAKRAYRNIVSARITEVSGLNAYMVLRAKQIIMSPQVLEELQTQFFGVKTP